MAVKPFTKEELNFFKFASIVLDEFPKMLRQTFVTMWDKIATLRGYQVWDDSPAVRNLLLTSEGGKTDIPTNKSFYEWDCTALFKATIYSKIFGLTTTTTTKTLSQQYLKGKKPCLFHSSVISPTGNQDESLTLAIDQLRLLRNTLCHISEPNIIKTEFDQYVHFAKDAFTAAGVSIDRIDDIGSLEEEDFPTNKVKELNEIIKDALQESNKFLQEEVVQRLSDQQENDKLFQEQLAQGLSDVLQRLDKIQVDIKDQGSDKEFGHIAKGFAMGALCTSLMYSKGGDLSFSISAESVRVVSELGITAVTLGGIYAAYKVLKPLVFEGAVTRGFGGERDDQEVRDIKPGSLHVLLHCFTDERFLEVLEEYECGRLKDSLHKEFLQIGIEIKGMKMETINMEEINKTKEAINRRTKESNSETEIKSDEIVAATSLESFTERTTPASPPSVDRPDGKTYRSMLNEYGQKMGAEIEYDEVLGTDQTCKEFRSVVKILGKTFECVGSHMSKKNSREMAAKEAMEHFNRLSAENSSKSNKNGSVISPPILGRNFEESESGLGTDGKEETVAFESPTNASSVIATTVISDTVSSTAVQSPDILTESAVEQAMQRKLSENTSKSLPRPKEPNSEKVELTKTETKSDEIVGVKPLESLTERTTPASPPLVERPDGKTYKSMLNEYGQRMEAVPKYEEALCRDQHSKEFRSVVTILGKTFECVGTHPSKKVSREMAAKEAMEYFNRLSAENSSKSKRSASVISPPILGEDFVESENGLGTDAKEKTVACESHTNASSVIATTVKGDTVSATAVQSPDVLTESVVEQAMQPKLSENTSKGLPRLKESNSEKEEFTKTETKSDEIVGVKPLESLTERTTPASPPLVERPDGKRYKSMLNEYGQRMGAVPKYDDILGTDQNGAEFRSVVTMLGKTFESVGFYSSKKSARDMAAKEAMEYFRAFSTLEEYVQKRKLDHSLRYVTKQDPTTNEYFSKIFLGKRCFKGKQSKPTWNRAEIPVIEIAMDTLVGRSGKPGRNCEELLNEYHEKLDFKTFPKYEEATINDDGKFSVEVKVKTKYEFFCKDTRLNKKDVEMWLAEQAVKVFEEEKKIIPAQANARSRLNLFLQAQDGDSKPLYYIQGDAGKFSGSLCFYAVDVYESLTPQPTKEEAISSAAMSACNAMDLL